MFWMRISISVIRENAYYEEGERLGCVRDSTYVMLTGCNQFNALYMKRCKMPLRNSLRRDRS